MKIQTMRLIDKWFGVPLCFFFTIIRKVFDGPLASRSSTNSSPQKILFIKLAEQGSTVLAYQTLKKACQDLGPDNIYFLLFDENRGILDALDIIPPKNIISIKSHSFTSCIVESLKALQACKKEGIDTTIDLEFFARSTAIISYLTGATKRVGLHGPYAEAPYRGDLMTHRMPFNHHIHTEDAFMLSYRCLSENADSLPSLNLSVQNSISQKKQSNYYQLDHRHAEYPVYKSSPQDKEHVRCLLPNKSSAKKKPKEKIILLNANCSDLLPLRKWPQENYIALAQKLLTKDNYYIFFTGGSSEAKATAQIVQKINHPRCQTLAGKTNFTQLLTLYQHSNLLITNDSGPAHFSSLTDMDTITIFGPETPLLFGSRSKKHHILWSRIACSPCVNALNNRQSSCQNNVCMQNISVQDVYTLATDVLEN